MRHWIVAITLALLASTDAAGGTRRNGDAAEQPHTTVNGSM